MKALILLLALLLAVVVPVEAKASPTAPDFHNCDYLTDLGEGNRVHYETGMHQIVGGDLLQGSDDVYNTSGQNNAVQCFCPPTGTGVQTNWLATNDSAIQADLALEGWINAGNGLPWGLEDWTYMAKNIDWECNEVVVLPPPPPPAPTPTPVPVPTPTPNPVPVPQPTPPMIHLPRTGMGGEAALFIVVMSGIAISLYLFTRNRKYDL